MNDGRTIEYRGIRFLAVGKGTLQCQTCLQVTHDHIGHAADHAAPTPVPLTATQLEALPVHHAVLCTTEHGRPFVALKIDQGTGRHNPSRWNTSDGPAATPTIAAHNPAHLVPAALDAALAAHEVEVRERIAQEIEAAVAWHASVGPGAENEILRTGMRSAARIVRGDVP